MAQSKKAKAKARKKAAQGNDTPDQQHAAGPSSASAHDQNPTETDAVPGAETPGTPSQAPASSDAADATTTPVTATRPIEVPSVPASKPVTPPSSVAAASTSDAVTTKPTDVPANTAPASTADPGTAAASSTSAFAPLPTIVASAPGTLAHGQGNVAATSSNAALLPGKIVWPDAVVPEARQAKSIPPGSGRVFATPSTRRMREAAARANATTAGAAPSAGSAAASVGGSSRSVIPAAGLSASASSTLGTQAPASFVFPSSHDPELYSTMLENDSRARYEKQAREKAEGHYHDILAQKDAHISELESEREVHMRELGQLKQDYRLATSATNKHNDAFSKLLKELQELKNTHEMTLMNIESFKLAEKKFIEQRNQQTELVKQFSSKVDKSQAEIKANQQTIRKLKEAEESKNAQIAQLEARLMEKDDTLAEHEASRDALNVLLQHHGEKLTAPQMVQMVESRIRNQSPVSVHRRSESRHERHRAAGAISIQDELNKSGYVSNEESDGEEEQDGHAGVKPSSAAAEAEEAAAQSLAAALEERDRAKAEREELHTKMAAALEEIETNKREAAAAISAKDAERDLANAKIKDLQKEVTTVRDMLKTKSKEVVAINSAKDAERDLANTKIEDLQKEVTAVREMLETKSKEVVAINSAKETQRWELLHQIHDLKEQSKQELADCQEDAEKEASLIKEGLESELSEKKQELFDAQDAADKEARVLNEKIEQGLEAIARTEDELKWAKTALEHQAKDHELKMKEAVVELDYKCERLLSDGLRAQMLLSLQKEEIVTLQERINEGVGTLGFSDYCSVTTAPIEPGPPPETPVNTIFLERPLSLYEMVQGAGTVMKMLVLFPLLFYIFVVFMLFAEYSIWLGANDLTRQQTVALSRPSDSSWLPGRLVFGFGRHLGVDYSILG